MTSPDTSPERPRGALLGSWRVDVTSAAWPILGPATALTAVGVLGIGAAFVSHGPFAHNEIAIFVGSACMLVGPLLAILGMRQLLKHEEYVAALERGLLLVDGGDERFVAWTEIAAVRHRAAAPAAIVVELRDGDPIVLEHPLGTIGRRELATHLEDLRRKAEFNLLG